ncbi:glycosyltransferase family 4 protein [Streptomyces iconiensis]|uniref:D-inositol 3-phosphate glycosyltransferase n=1 Tax=Streptomyces iconiensis TaxID=1384038 RepID=A0ABT7A8D7_9ACTN|nr:glycosyltransferase family 4 protein [Streptomyces iconiensis]MDJ1137611.1 glycosyltransferase family 4 protein [Streptomyces iconiensis]
MRIVFLLDNAYGIGGTIRSTVNLSRALAERHEVEVVSLRRGREKPALDFDPRVTLTPLIDVRRSSSAYDGADPRYSRPSERFTEGADHFERGIATRLGDLRMEALLRDLEADVVIGTRPKINDYLAAYGTERYLRIGQEHLTHRMHSAHVRTHQDAAIPRLDAFVTVSYADAADYRSVLPDAATQIVCIPNAVPPTDVEPSDGQAKLIVAAGRLIKVKRYDRLLRAFALVSEKHPDWTLRLYGRGRQHAALRATVNELGLYDRAFLMGARSPIDTEWAKGAIAAVSSDGESFGMTLVEAMHCGVPVVSTDCRYGPGEIIANGKDGLLSPIGDTEDFTVRAYADALLQLIEDPALRHRMSEAALRKAARYAPDRIAGEYERLVENLRAERPAGSRQAPGSPSPVADTPAPPADAPLAPPGAKTARVATATGGDSAPPSLRPGLTLRRVAAPVLRPVLPLLRLALRFVRGQREGQTNGLPRPVARVRVASDGSLVVRLRADRLPDGEAALLLRPRHQNAKAPVRLPLPPRGHARDGWTEIRLPRSGQDLSEARWDTYVERTRDGRRKRVEAELVETARLLTLPAPLGTDGALEPWVPYATSDGYLAVRAWHRTGHAEVTSLVLGRSAFTLHATLYGEAARAQLEGPTGPSDGPVLVAVPRGNPERAFEHPGTLAPDGAGGEGSVTLELPYELPSALAEGSTSECVWDLWLRPGEGLAPVRLARLLGDLADRKKTDVTPRARPGGSGWSARLYFSVNNNLALALQPVPEEPGAGAGQEAEQDAGQEAGARKKGAQKSRSSSPSASANV